MTLTSTALLNSLIQQLTSSRKSKKPEMKRTIIGLLLCFAFAGMA